jgi:hypothetical protein
MQDQQMDLLDAGRALVRHADVDVGLGQPVAHAAPRVAGQRDHRHLLGARRVDRSEHVRRVAAGRHREQHVAGAPSACTCFAKITSKL